MNDIAQRLIVIAVLYAVTWFAWFEHAQPALNATLFYTWLLAIVSPVYLMPSMARSLAEAPKHAIHAVLRVLTWAVHGWWLIEFVWAGWFATAGAMVFAMACASYARAEANKLRAKT